MGPVGVVEIFKILFDTRLMKITDTRTHITRLREIIEMSMVKNTLLNRNIFDSLNGRNFIALILIFSRIYMSTIMNDT